MKVIAIIQARMGSSRLPGKILLKINDIPIIQYIVESLKNSKKINQDRKSTRLNSSHSQQSRMPSSA